MIYTIPGQGFANTKSIYEGTHLTDVSAANLAGCSNIVIGVNAVLAVLKRYRLSAT